MESEKKTPCQMTALDVINDIEKQAGQTAIQQGEELLFVRTIEVDQWVRQGDIYIKRVAGMPSSKRFPTTSLQLAPGNTKGSRHIATGQLEYCKAGGNALQGPTISSPERFEITHPEHRNVSLPSGDYAITYQRDWEQEEIRRVAD